MIVASPPAGGRTCPAEGVGAVFAQKSKRRCAANLWIGCCKDMPHARHRDGSLFCTCAELA